MRSPVPEAVREAARRWLLRPFETARRVIRWAFFEPAGEGQGRGGRYAPALPRFIPTLISALIAVGALVWLSFVGLVDLAGVPVDWSPVPMPTGDLNQADRPDQLARGAVTAAGVFGGVFAIIYAYRKQRIDEADGHRSDAEQLSQRYQDAATQLGHDKAAVRLAGVYAMARLADDWPDQRQTCIDVLCAYLRLPYTPRPDPAAAGEPEPVSADAAPAVGAARGDTKPSEPVAEVAADRGEKEVRLTIIAVIRAHLLDPGVATTWCGRDLNFAGATFDGGSFAGACFTGGEVSFDEAQFAGGNVSFDEARFAGGEVSFHGARFSGGWMSFGSRFSGGEVSFSLAEFTGGEVSFIPADFAGGKVSFSGAWFAGGQVSFYWAHFGGGEVSFHGARFAGGQVSFQRARFTGGEVSFISAEFTGGEVSFSQAEFAGGQVPFAWARFTADGEVDFRHPEAWVTPPETGWTSVAPNGVLPHEWPPTVDAVVAPGTDTAT